MMSSVDNPMLTGINVDSRSAAIYHENLHIIAEHSRARNDVYVMPDMPVFCLLADKIPPTRNVVQWFDVSTYDELESDAAYLRSGAPRVIIAMFLPEFVFEGHEALIKTPLRQRELYAEIRADVASGKYKTCYAKHAGPSTLAEIGLRRRYTFAVVQRTRVTASELYDLFTDDSATIDHIHRRHGPGFTNSLNSDRSDATALHAGDLITLSLNAHDVDAALASGYFFPVRVGANVIATICKDQVISDRLQQCGVGPGGAATGIPSSTSDYSRFRRCNLGRTQCNSDFRCITCTNML